MVEPDRNNFPNLLQQVKNYLTESTGMSNSYVQHLHRLDRPTSGVILFTKQKEHLRNLSEQFANRTVSKFYLALTMNKPDENKGQLEHWHRKEKKKAANSAAVQKSSAAFGWYRLNRRSPRRLPPRLGG